jgi:hypothetical protein
MPQEDWSYMGPGRESVAGFPAGMGFWVTSRQVDEPIRQLFRNLSPVHSVRSRTTAWLRRACMMRVSSVPGTSASFVTSHSVLLEADTEGLNHMHVCIHML